MTVYLDKCSCIPDICHFFYTLGVKLHTKCMILHWVWNNALIAMDKLNSIFLIHLEFFPHWVETLHTRRDCVTDKYQVCVHAWWR